MYIKKLFLNLLVIACLIVAIWMGKQWLDTRQGGWIFLIDVGVLIWNISVLNSSHFRHTRPKFIFTAVLLFLIFAILSFVGVHPFDVYKNRIFGSINKSSSIVSSINIPSEKVFGTLSNMFVGTVTHRLSVSVVPNNNTLAGNPYKILLYEKGKLRDTSEVIKWNQSQINVGNSLAVSFYLTREEYDAYFMRNLEKIFSIKVVEAPGELTYDEQIVLEKQLEQQAAMSAAIAERQRIIDAIKMKEQDPNSSFYKYGYEVYQGWDNNVGVVKDPEIWIKIVNGSRDRMYTVIFTVTYASPKMGSGPSVYSFTQEILKFDEYKFFENLYSKYNAQRVDYKIEFSHK